MRGYLVVFEGLDQSGKETQAQLLRDRLKAAGRRVRVVTFPDYGTSLGEEIARALNGEREYSPDVLQLLFVANRYERKPDMEDALESGIVVLCDRYVASTVAYGEAQGLDPEWLGHVQAFLPQPDLTILLDITPETSVGRKSTDRDRFEGDIPLLNEVRTSYMRQASLAGWTVIDGERDKDAVAVDVANAVDRRLAQA